MDVVDAAVLLAAGVAAGTVNAVAGGGSLITFPTLLAIGLDPISANVTNSVAVTPGYIASVVGSRDELVAFTHEHGRAPLVRLVPTALVGMAVGVVALLLSPARVFSWIVPFLVLGAAVVLALQDRLRSVVGHPRNRSPRAQTIALHATVGLGAVYGGYFGAALGVMMVAALGLVLDEPLGRVNAIKNWVSAVVGIGTVVAFGLFGPVNWILALIVAPASLAGGWLGARLAGRLPARVLRGVIVAVGVVVSTVLLLNAH